MDVNQTKAPLVLIPHPTRSLLTKRIEPSRPIPS